MKLTQTATTTRSGAGTIVGFYLSKGDIENADLEGLLLLNELKWLEIRHVDIGDSDLAYSSKLTSLETFDLRESNVTTSTAAALQQKLPDCRILNEPVLGDNEASP